MVSLLPKIEDLLLTRGTDNRLEFRLTNPVTGQPVDLTNDTVKFTVKDSYGGTVKIGLENTPGMHSAQADGRTQFVVTREAIADATHTGTITDWVYEVRRLVSGADEVVYFAGIFSLRPTAAPAA